MPTKRHLDLLPLTFLIAASFASCWSPVAVAQTAARIEVDTKTVTGTVSPYFFGQFIEHEHNTIQGGLWAELLHDRKFEQGDIDGDGVSNGWVPEERVQDRYWELDNGSGPAVRYYIDNHDYYRGGASQAIELRGASSHASIYQIGLQFAKGKRYVFYVFLKGQGRGRAFVELDALRGPVFAHHDFESISRNWTRYTAAPPTEFNPNLPAFDGAATKSAEGKTVYICVVNRAENTPIEASVNLNGLTSNASARDILELTGKDRDSANPFGSTDNVRIRELPITEHKMPFEHIYPPHSVTVLEFQQ